MQRNNEIPLLTLSLYHPDDIVPARQRTRQLMKLLEYSASEQTRMTTAVSEIARNACQYAGGGTIRYSANLAAPPRLFIHVTDHGPGITHLASILSGHYRSATGLGLGIPGARRLVEHFVIQSSQQQGTNVALAMNMPAAVPALSTSFWGKIAEELVRYRPQGAGDETHQQNQELLQALDLLGKAHEELEQRVSERTAQLFFANHSLHQEINHRQEVETSLREVTTQLHLALQSARVGTWWWSVPANRLCWDDYACSLFGIKRAAFAENFEAFLEHLHPEDRVRVHREILAGIQQHHENHETEFRVIWLDGSIHYLMMRGKVYEDERGETVRMVGIYWDITEYKQSEEKLRTYRQQLTEAARASSLREMASALAHEINQPLATIAAYGRGCVRRLENNYQLTPEIIAVIKEMALEAERAGELVHRIKSFVRKGELFYETISPDLLMEEAIKLIQHEIENFSVAISYISSPGLPLVQVDKIQIQQVILNLLRNGIEAMREAGIAHPKLVVEAARETHNLLSISVTDNGPGVPETASKQLFNPYFTTKPQGIGMGLAICRTIIEAHGGHLAAANLPQGGCCFKFNLPVQSNFYEPANT